MTGTHLWAFRPEYAAEAYVRYGVLQGRQEGELECSREPDSLADADDYAGASLPTPARVTPARTNGAR